MIVARTRESLAAGLGALRESDGRLALVPTMGYLHEGHLSLLSHAAERARHLVVSIFVNPLQFGPTEDLGSYPRDLERDLELCGDIGADLVFVPDEGEVYRRGVPEVTVDAGPMGSLLCGAYRPGHFSGVLTVVAKLFALVRPDVAVFGRKDLQQGVLIRRMVSDLDLKVEVLLAPIVRAPDGLALSSRNVRLGPEERVDALGLVEGLRAACRAFGAGETDPRCLRDVIQEALSSRGSLQPQYVEFVHPDTLQLVERATPETVAALAALAGATRLIDNMVLGAAE